MPSFCSVLTTFWALKPSPRSPPSPAQRGKPPHSTSKGPVVNRSAECIPQDVPFTHRDSFCLNTQATNHSPALYDPPSHCDNAPTTQQQSTVNSQTHNQSTCTSPKSTEPCRWGVSPAASDRAPRSPLSSNHQQMQPHRSEGLTGPCGVGLGAALSCRLPWCPTQQPLPSPRHCNTPPCPRSPPPRRPPQRTAAPPPTVSRGRRAGPWLRTTVKPPPYCHPAPSAAQGITQRGG